MTASTRTVCLLVLNFNGRAHLQECLSTAIAAAARYAGPCTVVLVDNRSTDDSVAFCGQAFPSVEIVVSPSNDFLFSLNDAVRARAEEIVVVLNNDMRFDPDFVAPLVSHFDDREVFAAGAAIRTWDGEADTVGPRCARLDRWWFHKWWSFDRQEPALSLEASGGAAAYRRTMFLELDGFDSLYRPGYYEDLDLTFRAWARGWKTIYEPRSRVYHKESVSMLARFGDSGKARLLYRNHVLFTIKNVGGAGFLAGFFLLLPYRVLSPLARGYRVPLMGCLRALPLMPAALARRFRRRAVPLDVARFERVVPISS
jgi:GT2 family glycosyltransferase